jgi:hypothetical protein
VVQQIGDAVEHLRHWAPEDLLDAATDAAEGHPDEAAAVEAAWINAAVVAKTGGEPARETPGEPLPDKPLSDTAGEAAFLQRVQLAYAQLTRQDGELLLDSAREMAA